MEDKLIFIIDDDIVQNEIHTILLNKVFPDTHIISFNSAEKALKVLQEQNPKYIFLDLNMPNDGNSVLLDAHLKLKLNSEIYLMSSTPYLDDSSVFSKYPAVKDFIAKPLLAHKLKNILNEFV